MMTTKLKHRIRFSDILLLEDDDYMIVNKPAGLSTLEDRSDPLNLLAMAREYHAEAQVCHRLDKDTSGVLVLARNPEAYRHLSLQFQNRTVEKVYQAVCDGLHNFHDTVVDRPLKKSSDGVVRIHREGQPARTVFDTVAVYRMHTLVSCRPITGRMHQIRVHLASRGAPITGDTTYGGKQFYLSALKRHYNIGKGDVEEPLVKRLALHASSIRFENRAHEAIAVEAPLPKDLRALIRQLEANR
jgi:23S rRNA pseudouridine955/2504/2580 synthase